MMPRESLDPHSIAGNCTLVGTSKKTSLALPILCLTSRGLQPITVTSPGHVNRYDAEIVIGEHQLLGDLVKITGIARQSVHAYNQLLVGSFD